MLLDGITVFLGKIKRSVELLMKRETPKRERKKMNIFVLNPLISYSSY